VLEKCGEVIELCREVGRIGFQASLSDAGVGAQMARAAAGGAYQNVGSNVATFNDPRKKDLLGRADAAFARAQQTFASAEEETLKKLRGDAAAK